MKAIVFGVGAVGARVARQLASSPQITELILVDINPDTAEEAVTSIGAPARSANINALRMDARLEAVNKLCENVDVAVVTTPLEHVEICETALVAGAHVVSTSDDVETVEALFNCADSATAAGKSLIIGAGFAPGLTDLLALHAAKDFDVVDEINVAKFGTGGPACARQHHKALRNTAVDWRNQKWEQRHGGAGRELCWFPDPVGGLDCYQASVPDLMLLLPAFPEVVRAAARVAATRRDRATKWLPMLRRPHPEGTVGAVRVEVRGWRNSLRDVKILGALDRPAVAAGTIAAVTALWAVEDRLKPAVVGGLATVIDNPIPMLHELALRGIKAATFEGFKWDEY